MLSIASPTSWPTAGSELRGVQQPRIRLVPDYVSSAGEQALALCRLAGLELDPWEQLVLIDSLGERVDGKWAAFEVGVDAPRQNGKGLILEARELTGLFLLNERLIIHSAHEQATSSEHFRRLLNLIEGVPEFEQRVLKAPRGKGSEAIELRGGQRIFFKTRTGGGGRGLTGDLVVLDEDMILPVAVTATLVPTMAARSIVGNPQLWYAGSAVDQEKHEHGVVAARLRERALRGVPRLAYFSWSVEGDDPSRVPADVLDDPAVWAQANPGLGIRISLEHIANERAGALGSREFAVERLGIGDWPDTSDDAGRVISREAWAELAETDRSKRIAGPPIFAADANPDQTRVAIAVAGARDDGLFQTAVVAYERGTDWLVDHCVELKAANPRMRLAIDKRGPLAEKIEALKAAKIRLIELSTEDYGRACQGFFSAVSERRFRYPAPQPELDEALSGARKKSMSDAWKWSRRDSTSADISPLVAVTLALWAAEAKKPRARVINLNDV